MQLTNRATARHRLHGDGRNAIHPCPDVSSSPHTTPPDYFDQLVECARRMIAKGYLYADDTPVERMREVRGRGRRRARVDDWHLVFGLHATGL